MSPGLPGQVCGGRPNPSVARAVHRRADGFGLAQRRWALQMLNLPEQAGHRSMGGGTFPDSNILPVEFLLIRCPRARPSVLGRGFRQSGHFR